MGIERLEKRASEKEPVARPFLNTDVSLKDQKRAELLRSRIEELDRRLAMLNSKRGLFENLLDGVRRMDDMYCGPVLRHSAEPTQAANFRSAVAF